MAFNATDLAEVEDAIRIAVRENIFRGSLAGQSAETYTLEQLHAHRRAILADLATANEVPGLGIRIQRFRRSFE
jgi:hypothetical protein